MATPVKTTIDDKALVETQQSTVKLLQRQFFEFDFWRQSLKVAEALGRRRRFLAWVIIAGGLVSVAVAFAIPSWYQSTLTLMPPDSPSSLESRLAALGGAGMGLYSEMFTMHTTGAQFMNILRSRTVLDQIATDLDLKTAYGVSRANDVRSLLAASTDISEDRKSGVIILTVTDRDPRRAHRIALAYIEGLNRLVSNLNTSAAHRERVFIEERLKVIKNQLDVDARELSEFSSRSAMLNLQEQGRVMLSAAATLQDQVVAAESQLKALEQVYTPNNTRVRMLQARIAELKRELGKLNGGGKESREMSTEERDSAAPSIRELPRLAVTYQDLSQRVRIQEGVYESLTKQYELAKVEEAKEIPSVRLLDPPNIPEQKAGPSRRMICYLGVVLSFVMGCAWVLIVSAWEGIEPDDPRKLFAREISRTFQPQIADTPDGEIRNDGIAARVWRRYTRHNGDRAADSK